MPNKPKADKPHTHQITTISATGDIVVDTYPRMPDYHTLRDKIGDAIQIVPHFVTYEGRKCTVYCDENSKIKRPMPPRNDTATMLWRDALKFTDAKYKAGKFRYIPTLLGTVIIVQTIDKCA